MRSMTVTIERDDFEDIMQTMRELKVCLDDKVAEKRKSDQLHKKQIRELTAQLDMADTKLETICELDTADRKKYDRIKTQIMVFQKENKKLKAERIHSTVLQKSTLELKCQLEHLQRTTEELTADLKRTGEVYQIQRKEIEIILQLKNKHGDLNADANCILETNYQLLQAKIAEQEQELQKYERLKIEHEKLVAKSSQFEVEGNKMRKIIADAETSAAAAENKLSSATKDHDILTTHFQKEKQELEEQVQQLQRSLKQLETEKVAWEKRSQEEKSMLQIRLLEQIQELQTSLKQLQAEKCAWEENQGGEAKGELDKPLSETTDRHSRAEVEKKELKREVDRLSSIVDEQSLRLHELNQLDIEKTTVIQTHETLAKISEHERIQLAKRVKSLKKSVSKLQNEGSDDDRLRNENAELKADISRLKSHVDHQARYLRRHKDAFFDQEDSTISMYVPGSFPEIKRTKSSSNAVLGIKKSKEVVCHCPVESGEEHLHDTGTPGRDSWFNKLDRRQRELRLEPSDSQLDLQCKTYYSGQPEPRSPPGLISKETRKNRSKVDMMSSQAQPIDPVEVPAQTSKNDMSTKVRLSRVRSEVKRKGFEKYRENV